MAKNEEKKWKKFEKLISEIQKSLAPSAQVIHNEKVFGKITQTNRQVDISVKQNIGHYKIFIAIECKDCKDPVDIDIIEGFAEKLKDIEANKGVIVSASGFTETAKKKAGAAGIEIYRLVDTSKHDWQTDVSIPVVCDFRKIKRSQFVFKSSIPGPCTIPTTDPRFLFLYRENGSVIDTVHNILLDKWNKGQVSQEPGIHENIKLIEYPTCVKHKGTLYHLDVLANIEIERNLYYGKLQLKEIKGFRDEKTGGIITSGFTTDQLDTKEVEKSWQKIEDEKDLVIKPMMTCHMSDHYPLIKMNSAE